MGAVSNMMRLYSIELTCFITSAKFIASSTPGMENARSCMMPDIGLLLSSTHVSTPNNKRDKKANIEYDHGGKDKSFWSMDRGIRTGTDFVQSFLGWTR